MNEWYHGKFRLLEKLDSELYALLYSVNNFQDVIKI